MKFSLDSQQKVVKISTSHKVKFKMWARPPRHCPEEEMNYSIHINWTLDEVGLPEDNSDIFLTLSFKDAQHIHADNPAPREYVLKIKYPVLYALDDNEDGEDFELVNEENIIRQISVQATSSRPFSIEHSLSGSLCFNAESPNAEKHLYKMKPGNDWIRTIDFMDTASLHVKKLTPHKVVKGVVVY